MSELLPLLTDAVAARSRDKAVALLLSGGLDSISVGLALQAAGKVVRAYTYHLEGYPSRDLKKAIAIAHHFGWPLTIIRVPKGYVAADFMRLAVEQHCYRKTQFEVLYPLLYVFPQIEEVEVFAGWNADDHYGNDRECALRQARMARQGRSLPERKEAFDAERRAHFEQEMANPESGDTWWYASRLAEQHGKRLLDPYLDQAAHEYFLQFDHEQLSPLGKPLVRQQLAHQLGRLPKGSIAVGVRLQTGGGVDTLFATLLNDDRINRFDKKYTTISALCRRWGKEVSGDLQQFQAELQALPPRRAAVRHVCAPGRYEAYAMADVSRAAALRKFTCISTFTGGGGSDVGLGLAGGRVVLGNEFVPEAARTHATNFKDATIDRRDIREIIPDPTAIEAFLAQAGLRPGELDILNGSPPCCEFSTGRRK